MFKEKRFENFLYSDFWKFVENTIKTKMYYCPHGRDEYPIPLHGEEAIIFLNNFIKQTQKLFSNYGKYSPSVWNEKVYDENWLENFSEQAVKEAEIAMRFQRLETLKYNFSKAQEFKNSKKTILGDETYFERWSKNAKSDFFHNLAQFNTIKHVAECDISDYIVSEVMGIAQTIESEFFTSIDKKHRDYILYSTLVSSAPTSNYLFGIKFLVDKQDSFGFAAKVFNSYSQQSRWLKFHHYRLDEFKKLTTQRRDDLYEEAIQNIDSDAHCDDYEKMLASGAK